MIQENSFQDELARARRGDREALGLLLERVERYGEARVASSLGTRLAGRIRESDVLQHAWLEVIQSLDDFRGETEDAFSAWVNAVIANTLKRLARFFQAKRRKSPSGSGEVHLFEQTHDERAGTPSVVLMRWEDVALVSAALEKLGDDQRQIIRLAIMEGLSHAEIAERMGRSEGSARMLLSRARAALLVEVQNLERPTPDGS